MSTQLETTTPIESLATRGQRIRRSCASSSAARNELASVIYHDVQLTYDVPAWDMKFAVGARNVFGQNPPVSYSEFIGSFDSRTYDLPGIPPYLRLSKKF